MPRLTPDEHLVKIRDCVATRLTPTAIERGIDLATRLETLGLYEVRELIRLADDVGIAA